MELLAKKKFHNITTCVFLSKSMMLEYTLYKGGAHWRHMLQKVARKQTWGRVVTTSSVANDIVYGILLNRKGVEDAKESWIKMGNIATTCEAFEQTIIQWEENWV